MNRVPEEERARSARHAQQRHLPRLDKSSGIMVAALLLRHPGFRARVHRNCAQGLLRNGRATGTCLDPRGIAAQFREVLENCGDTFRAASKMAVPPPTETRSCQQVPKCTPNRTADLKHLQSIPAGTGRSVVMQFLRFLLTIGNTCLVVPETSDASPEAVSSALSRRRSTPQHRFKLDFAVGRNNVAPNCHAFNLRLFRCIHRCEEARSLCCRCCCHSRL